MTELNPLSQTSTLDAGGGESNGVGVRDSDREHLARSTERSSGRQTHYRRRAGSERWCPLIQWTLC